MSLPLFVTAAVLAASSGAPQDAGANAPVDAELVRAIEREFLSDPAVPARAVDVESDDGIVTLSGSVGHLLARERAVQVAEIVKGVEAVVNRIEVDPARPVEDAELRRRVEEALRRDPATDSFEVEASVADGIVTLTGSVDSWSERRLCGTVTRGTNGVRQVLNEIVVDYDDDRGDGEIRREIEQILRWDVLVDDGLVDVEVTEGAVTLSGVVGSAAEKRRARLDGWVAGVSSVDASGLEVARWARDDDLRDEKYAFRTDDEIEGAVEAALRRDPRVLSFDVDVSVSSGHVTLSGVVDNLAAMRAAKNDARNTVGVRTVVNLLKVRPAGLLGDERIAVDVRQALRDDSIAESLEIDVQVLDGHVTLSGTVDSFFEKAHADDVASRVNGVVEVANHLRVAEQGPYAYDPWVDHWNIYDFDWYGTSPVHTVTPDARIEWAIERELHWSPFVDADDVAVRVEDGVATLSGEVDSWLEVDAARENAYEAGASYVRSRLRVQEDGPES